MSPGEAADRLSILGVKAARVECDRARATARAQLELLRDRLGFLLRDEACAAAYAGLVAVNERLWDVENGVRRALAAGDERAFAARAADVPRLNAERSELKARLDGLLGCALAEVKEYRAR